jgi:hypothetical protein
VTFNCGGAATITVTSTKTIISADTTIDGGSLITISGGSSVGVFSVNSGVNFTVQNLTIANGNAGEFGNGGGIYSADVTNSTFSGNSAGGPGSTNGNGNGGAIASYGTVTVTVTNSTFSGNSAADGWGGGIYNLGTLTVTNSTFSGNRAYRVGASGGVGGGAISNDGTLEVTNSTFSGNSTGGVGGGIFNYGGTVAITNSTFTGNSASVGGGGIYNNVVPVNLGTVTVTNTIVANSTSGGNCGSCCGGGVTDDGHNIDDGTTCGFRGAGCTNTSGSSFCNTNPDLDPTGLQNNGGPTQTIALQAGSPAIKAGDEATCAAPPINNLDQRGYPRPGHGATSCSIGAYEYNRPGSSDCCQCPTSCAAPVNGSCGACIVVFGATCESGQLCVLHTPTPSPTPTATATNTPGTNDCCQCADFCAAPVVGTCGGCAVVLGASCGTEGLCVSRTPGAPTATKTATATPTRTASPTPTPTTTPTSAPTPIPCVGDCDGNSVVTVDEILTMVNIALGNADAAACPYGIPSGAQVDVALILQAVNNALNGCTTAPSPSCCQGSGVCGPPVADACPEGTSPVYGPFCDGQNGTCDAPHP